MQNNQYKTREISNYSTGITLGENTNKKRSKNNYTKYNCYSYDDEMTIKDEQNSDYYSKDTNEDNLSLCLNNKNKVLHFIPNENTIKTYFVLLFAVNCDLIHKLRDIPYIIHFLLLSKIDKLNEGRLITLNSFLTKNSLFLFLIISLSSFSL